YPIIERRWSEKLYIRIYCKLNRYIGRKVGIWAIVVCGKDNVMKIKDELSSFHKNGATEIDEH
ncbi:MAG: hypothetical protein ACUVTL_03585, partial [Thermoproteota archaeon]